MKLYEGDFQEDKIHGFGTIKYANGNEYEGDFANDKKHGQGTFRVSHSLKHSLLIRAGRQAGRQSVGGLVRDSAFVRSPPCPLIHCVFFSILQYADGHVFEGQYANGNSHGMGTIKWADGEADVWQYHIGKPFAEGAVSFFP